MRQLKFGFGKHLPMILQTEGSECGLACLAMIASYHGYHTDLSEMRKRFSVSLKGATLAQISTFADKIGLTTRALRLELKQLPKLQTPALLHWDMKHYVVLKSVRGDKVIIHDPALGEVKMKLATVSSHFTGVALEFGPSITFERKQAAPPIKLSRLMGNVVGMKRGLAQILVLALVIEVFSLVMPLLTEWITDEAVVAGDHGLLGLLVGGMITLGISNTMIGTARSWIGLYISTNFNMQWMSNVMGHLLKLPVEYFERRHLGDIVSRFGAVRSIEHALTSGAIDATLDGLLSLGTLSMMLIYSPTLAAVSIAAVGLYGVLRWARYESLRFAEAGAIVKQAKEQTYFLETIRGVRSIKLFNREQERRSAWLNLWVDATNASLISQKLHMIFSSSWSLLSILENAGVFWLGANLVITHHISLGMLFAFLGYKEQFSSRVNQLIDRVVQFKMLNIYADRLSDIVLSAPEEKATYRHHDMPEDLTIKLEKISYRYSSEDPDILRGANLTIRAGECVALVGASGCGKTTCLKILLGILKPKAGKVIIGGLSIQQIGLKNYRDVIATVMQDDQLFAGSLFDNISFLDASVDEEWLHECAKAANIHDEIIAMPMGYHTLVGDMGTVLSGGQKQRVMLARALYSKPKILFLDEATSHLDLENETKIGAAISKLNITRIMVAHRPQTIAIADRVIKIEKGHFLEVPSDANVAVFGTSAAILSPLST